MGFGMWETRTLWSMGVVLCMGFFKILLAEKSKWVILISKAKSE